MKNSRRSFGHSLVVCFFIALAMALIPHGVLAAGTCYSQSDGNWSSISWWCNDTNGVRTLVTDDDVVIQHNVTLNQDATVKGITIDSGKTFNNGSSTLTANGGYLTNNGTYNRDTGTYSFTGNGGVYGSSTTTFNNVMISASVDFGNGKGVIDNTLTINNSGSVPSGKAPSYASGSTLKYNTGSATAAGEEWYPNTTSGAGVPHHVWIGNGTTLDFGANSSARTAKGDVRIDGGLTLSTNIGGDLKLGGNWTKSGAFTPNGREVEFNGSGAQTINSATTWAYLAINNSGSGVTLAANQDVTTRLRFASGLLKLAGYNLTLGGSAEAVAGTLNSSNMVVTDGGGALCKQFTANGSYDYPIGDDTSGADYSPVTSFSVSGSSYSGAAVCFRVTDAASSNLPNNLTTYITRYWTGSQSGTIGGLSYGATFNFVAADKAGTQDMHGKKWNGSFPWVELNAVSGNSFSGSGLTSFSDFTAFRSGILAVTLAEFYAEQVNDHVLVSWETASELGNMGFNLLRGTSPAGWDRQLNDLLIPSQSLGNPGGFVYTWEDAADLVPGTTYYYWLQDVDVNGATTLHGPVSVDFVTPTAVTLGGVSANQGLEPLHYSTAAALPALSWLAVVAGAGVALALGRRRTAK